MHSNAMTPTQDTDASQALEQQAAEAAGGAPLAVTALGTAAVEGSQVGLQLHQWMAQLQVRVNVILHLFGVRGGPLFNMIILAEKGGDKGRPHDRILHL